MIGFSAESSVEDNKNRMIESMEMVKSGQITYAVRDTSIDGMEIKTGDYMGIDDNGIKSVGTDISEVMINLIDKMKDEDSELLSIYYGSDVSKEEAEQMVEVIEEKYPDFEIELQEGSQPIYYYIISLE